MKELFRKINSNLKVKVVLIITCIFVLFLAGYIQFNVRNNRAFYMENTENQLRSLARTIELSLVDAMGHDRRDDVQRIIERIGSGEDVTELRIFSSNRVILRSSNHSEIGSPIDPEIFMKYDESGGTVIYDRPDQAKISLLMPISNQPACYGCHVSSQKINGILVVSISTAKADTMVSQHMKDMVLAAIIVSLLIVLSVFIVLELLVNRPILHLKKAMGMAEEGGEVVLDKRSPDEIGKLQGKFVDMLGKISDLHKENTKNAVELSKKMEISNSHARLKSMIEAMPDGVAIMSRDMVIQDMNPRNSELFPGVKVGDFCYKSIHGRSEPCSHCGVIGVFEDGSVHQHQSSFYLADGTQRIVHSISAPLRDKDGNITHAIEVVRDITEMMKAERVRSEEQLRHKKELEKVNIQLTKRVGEVEEANAQIATLIKDLASKNTDLEKVVERLTTVNQIGSILNSLVDKDNVLDVIVKTMARTMNAKICSLMLVDQENQELEVVTSVGLNVDKLNRVKIGEGISGYVAKEGKPLLVTDIESDPRFLSRADYHLQYTTSSLIAAPLFSKGKVIGVLNINNKISGEGFHKDDLELLTTVAGQAAIAVENSNLYNDIKSSYFDTVRALVNALEAKDKYSKGHSERVTLLAMMMADEMGLPEDRKQALQHAGVLHDIGKIGISLNILNKKGKLSGEEFDIIKNHPIIGERILDPITFLKDAKTIVAQHHERYDGNGYPNQRSGKELCLEAKILAVADTFDALTSDRPYRKALPFDDAVAEVKRCSSTQFDPDIVDAFIKTISNGSGKPAH